MSVMIDISRFLSFLPFGRKQEDSLGRRSSFGTIAPIDYSVIACGLALLIIGLVMVYSASICPR